MFEDDYENYLKFIDSTLEAYKVSSRLDLMTVPFSVYRVASLALFEYG